MVSIAIDRLDGLSSSTAIKGPCRVATTANITLSGEQTIDGVAVVADDRVLVKNQTAASENGIWIAAAGSWRRAKDFSRTDDVRKGTQVAVTDGTLYAVTTWHVATANPITIGTTSIVFAQASQNPDDFDTFETRTAAAAYSPGIAPATVRTFGYATAGDGGGALYKTAVSEPSHAGKFSMTLAGGTTAWFEIVPEMGRIDARQIGCVMDGAISINDGASEHTPTGTGLMSGTDNYTAMRNAYGVAKFFGVTLWLAGFFYIRVPDGFSSNVIEVENLHLAGPSPELCGIYFGGSHAYTAVQQSANTMIGPASRYSASLTRTTYDYFIIENVTLRGAWWYEVENANRSWATTFPYRVHGPSPWNYRHARLQNVRVWDAIGFGIYGKSCIKMEVINCDVRRNTADGIRGEDVSDYTVRDCFVDSSGDDAITNPQPDDTSNTLRPRVGRCLITGNTVIRSEGILILGPAQTVVANNKLKLCGGTGLSVFAPSANTDQAMGEGGMRTCIVANNIVEDQMYAPVTDAAMPGTWEATAPHGITIQGGIAWAGSTALPLGESAGSDANPPWYGTDVGWGALHLFDAVDTSYTAVTAAASGYRAYGLIVANNIIVRTLPAVATYSLWGMGERHMRWGYENPAVTDANFAVNGMRFGGMFDSAVVQGNEIKGFISGAGIFLDDAENDLYYKSFLITGNTIKDCRNGIYTDASGTRYQDITVLGNLIDCDPRRIQTERDKTAGDHGKWTTIDGTAPACVNLSAMRGCKVISNVFMNAANPWLLEGGATETITHNTVRGNIGVVDFVNGTASPTTTDAANRGLGRIHRASPMITYEVRDLDPASGTYNQTRAGMQHYSAAIPASGYYVAGHRVDRTTGGYWQRLTTGTAHVDTTDWLLVS